VENRISPAEFASDTQMLDPNARTCLNSPASRQLSPQITVGDPPRVQPRPAARLAHETEGREVRVTKKSRVSRVAHLAGRRPVSVLRCYRESGYATWLRGGSEFS